MSAAFISTCILAVAVLTAAAEPPMKVIGEGLLTKPMHANGQPANGVRYAGPVVYTNEKPPIIFFPPPPKDAKPGLGGVFGKKPPKAIKYVPMPAHDLPVLIYTSDKMPPIHVVQPGQVVDGTPFGPPNGEFRSAPPPLPPVVPPTGSLSSAYRGILREATAPRIVSSSYEIPSTSYGTPVKALGSSLGSLDLSSTDSSNANAESSSQKSELTHGKGLTPPPQVQPATGVHPNSPPHVLYSGHPPVHVFNEPNMFVQAPREIPLKTYADMPPKASFGPPKSFGPPSINSFAVPHSHPYRPHLAAGHPPPYYSRPSPSVFLPSRENVISSASSQSPSAILPSPSDLPNVESKTPVSPPTYHSSQFYGRPPVYSFRPPPTVFNFGPFSIEYGEPNEPFMEFSEHNPVEVKSPLSSFYGAMNDGSSSAPSQQISSAPSALPGMEDDGWMPGPLPDQSEGQIKEMEAWDAPMPPPLPVAHQPRPISSFYGGPRHNPMHNSVLLPSGPHPHHLGSMFSGSKLAHFLSTAFSRSKFKRSKPKYEVAPKSMAKPPIIIYYGQKPPVHVMQKPAEVDYGSQTSASATSAVTVTSPESPSSDGKTISNDNNGNSKEGSIENAELSFGGSQNSEVRVAAPPSPTFQLAADETPAIIPAKPVDISFASSELQPSIYMARNSLNTILVSDLSGSGTNTIKTYIVRGDEDSQGKSIPVAQNRISGEMVADQNQEKQVESTGESENASSSTIVLALASPQQDSAADDEEEEMQPQASERAMPSVIRSPSSFQTSLSQAEKEAEEAAEASSL